MRYPLKNWRRIKRGYKFGEKTFYSERHLGADYVVPEGTPVFAPANCEIVVSGNFPEGGNTLHAVFRSRKFRKIVMRCMHLKELPEKGKYKEGEILGYTGNTGELSTSPHLHLDISKKEVKIKDL